MVILGGILLFNLFSVQIIQGDYYQKLSDSNRIRTQTIHAPRGVIFDRNGTPLVYNTPGFRLTKNCDPQKDIKCETTHLSQEQALPLLAKGSHDIEVDSLREYRYKEVTSHVLGYIGQISEEEIKMPEYEGYLGNDWVGKSGIEDQYEQQLRGINGKELIEVDATGQKVRSLGQTDPIPGQDVSLSIDLKVQEAAYKAASEVKKGAIVVSTPDGEILAMVSKPSYDPNLFTLDETYKASTESGYTDIASILTDGENQPLLNRPIEGVYPPASTFKIITSAAGLENKVIDKNFRMKDTGILKVGEFSYANWYYTQYGKTEEGDMDVQVALARSNDIFYYKLAEMITVEKLASMANNFGVGKQLGVDIGNEAKGVLPTKDWKQKNIGEGWYLGDTYHYGIGQGFLLATPLQVNKWAEIIANGGTLYQPRFIKDGEAVALSNDFLSDETINLVRGGMVKSCAEGGVAYPLYNYKVANDSHVIDGKNYIQDASGSAKMTRIPVACKTGTGQHGGEETPPHAWITLFAPAYNPEVVVTVLVDSGGEGSSTAAPIAKKVLDAYFSK
jgi:penicillin-binding protein 2